MTVEIDTWSSIIGNSQTLSIGAARPVNTHTPQKQQPRKLQHVCHNIRWSYLVLVCHSTLCYKTKDILGKGDGASDLESRNHGAAAQIGSHRGLGIRL